MILGLMFVSVVFFICVQLNSSKSAKSLGHAPKTQSFFYAEKAEGRPVEALSDLDVFDSHNRGVRFVSGVQSPKSKASKRMQNQEVFQQDEIEYYKRKNKLLYKAKAEAVKARFVLQLSKFSVHFKLHGYSGW